MTCEFLKLATSITLIFKYWTQKLLNSKLLHVKVLASYFGQSVFFFFGTDARLKQGIITWIDLYTIVGSLIKYIRLRQTKQNNDKKMLVWKSVLLPNIRFFKLCFGFGQQSAIISTPTLGPLPNYSETFQ